MHEQPFAGLQPGHVEGIGPDREEGLGQGGGLDEREPGRHGQGVGLMDQAVLGIAAAMGKRADQRARNVAGDAGADGDHLAGDFEAGQIRCARRWRIAAFALGNVGPVHARSGHLDQDLAGARLRHGARFERENFRPAGAGDGDYIHRRGQGHGDLLVETGSSATGPGAQMLSWGGPVGGAAE